MSEDRTVTEKLLFACLRAVVNGECLCETDITMLTAERQKALYHLSKSLDVANMVAHALETSKVFLTNDAKEHFERQKLTSLYRHELLCYETERMLDVLEQAGISHLPLKGGTLRRLYPQGWMRTSCDVDILVHETDLQRAVQTLERDLGYRNDGIGNHDAHLIAPNGTHLELHYTLCIFEETCDRVLTKVWEHAAPEAGKQYCYEMSTEFLLFYLLAHMAKHLRCGGCGVRPFLDLYLLRRACVYDTSGLQNLCADGNFSLFCEHVFHLTDVWFSDATPNALDRRFASYVLGAGAFGSMSNLVTIKNFESGGKARYVFRRLFPPKSQLCVLYPSLKKYPYLFRDVLNGELRVVCNRKV